jgi:hypothetical protein
MNYKFSYNGLKEQALFKEVQKPNNDFAIVIYNYRCSLISKRRTTKFKGSPMSCSSTPNKKWMKRKMNYVNLLNEI